MKIAATTRGQRGQGTVELALGALVFVTILMAGIQFAEIGFLSLKVQEASNFALWTTTAKRVHFTNNFPDGADALADLLGSGGTSAETLTQNRFQDFHPDPGGGNSLTMVMTRARQMQVDCNPRAAAVRFVINNAARNAVGSVFPVDRGGASCQARARLRNIRVPENLAQHTESGGFFSEANSRFQGLLTVCSLGRPEGGQCAGRYPILLGEWALHGNGEGARIDFDQVADNRVYYEATEEVYGRLGGGGGGGAAFANRFAGGVPGGIGFHMSYIPAMDGSMQGRFAAHGMPASFNTSGVPTGTALRGPCFFGLSGC